MSVELRPLGVICNLQCAYCYQNPQRAAGNVSKNYDLGRMKAGIVAEGGPFTLFGGEPLLVPKPDLEELWSWGFVYWGHNGVQTNGVLIDSDHVEMFKKYNVAVGISIDGPGDLNSARRSGSAALTRAATAKTEANILRLCREWQPPSLILTLHRYNALGEGRELLQAWLRQLDAIGVNSVRLHVLEVDDAWSRTNLALSAEENIDVLLSFARFESTLGRMRFDLFNDMRNQLLGRDQSTTCIWNACDPLTTRAVRGVEGMGQRSNCGRTNKEGIDFVKAEHEGFERYLALYNTPPEYGGCSGCRFFLMCKGQCPGTAIDGDWRNRTEHCSIWMTLFEVLETGLLTTGHLPLSHESDRRAAIERIVLDAWQHGSPMYMHTALNRISDATTSISPE